MLQESLTQQKWKHLLIKNQPLNITHIDFANDNVLFYQGSDEGLTKLLNIRHKFSLAWVRKSTFQNPTSYYIKKAPNNSMTMCVLF